MKKQIATILFLLTFSFSLPMVLSAQSDPPHPNSGSNPGGGNNPVGGGAPVGEGLILLLSLGMSYGGYTFYKSKKKSLLD
nr:hypothetical protein [Bacteroidota bacterium]